MTDKGAGGGGERRSGRAREGGGAGRTGVWRGASEDLVILGAEERRSGRVEDLVRCPLQRAVAAAGGALAVGCAQASQAHGGRSADSDSQLTSRAPTRSPVARGPARACLWT